MRRCARRKRIKGFYFTMLIFWQGILIVVLMCASIIPVFSGVREILMLTALRYMCLALVQHILHMNEHDRRTMETAVKSALLTLLNASICALNSMECFGVTVGCIVLGDYILKCRMQDNKELEQLVGDDIVDFDQRKESVLEKYCITGAVIIVNVIMWINNR